MDASGVSELVRRLSLQSDLLLAGSLPPGLAEGLAVHEGRLWVHGHLLCQLSAAGGAHEAESRGPAHWRNAQRWVELKDMLELVPSASFPLRPAGGGGSQAPSHLCVPVAKAADFAAKYKLASERAAAVAFCTRLFLLCFLSLSSSLLSSSLAPAP